MDAQDNSNMPDENHELDSALAELFPSLGDNFPYSNPLAVLLSSLGTNEDKGHGTNLYNPFNLPMPRLQEIHAMATANLISQTQEAIMQEYNFLDLDFGNTNDDRNNLSTPETNVSFKQVKSDNELTKAPIVSKVLTDQCGLQCESVAGKMATEMNVSLQQHNFETDVAAASKSKFVFSEDEMAVRNLINNLSNTDHSCHNVDTVNEHRTPVKKAKLDNKVKDCQASFKLDNKSEEFSESDVRNRCLLGVDVPASNGTNIEPMTAREMQTDCRSCDANCVVNDSTEDVLMDNVLYVCHICLKQFTNIEDMNMHCKNHQKYVCPQDGCAKTFTYRSHYHYHLKTHSGSRGHQCEVCGSVFSAPHHLTDHMRTHTQDRPFSCTQCDKSFTTLSQLTNHERIHTGEKPYKCDVPGCDKSFVESSSLKKHKVTHTGDKPYKCGVCQKGFSQSSSRSYHMRKAHPEGS